MKQNYAISKLRTELVGAKRAAKTAADAAHLLEARIIGMENSCIHVFGKVISAHTYREAYIIPGDKPGTIGGPCHVPAKTDKKWTRTCSICGKVEATTRTKTKNTEEPSF